MSSLEIMHRLRETLPVTGYSPQYEYLEVSDHENIGSCYRQIREGMDGWLTRRLLDPDTVFVDITGGTKAMTAALTLAGVERFRRFTYVGGEMRDRDDTGVVMTGSERVVRTENPWDTYAVRDLERANHLLSEPSTPTWPRRSLGARCRSRMRPTGVGWPPSRRLPRPWRSQTGSPSGRR